MSRGQLDKLSSEDTAYLAGLLDGEGHISILKYKRVGYRTRYSLHVTITNTNLEVLNWCRDITGIGSVLDHHKEDGIRKNSWRWVVNCRKAYNLLLILLPYLKIKYPQAENAIDFQKEIKHLGGKFSPESKIKRQEEHYRISRKLNKRGPD